MTATEFPSRKATACSCLKSAASAPSASDHHRPAWEFLHWLGSASILLLMPKCPLCFAAYLALATGMGVGLTTAACLRVALLVLCGLSLAYLTLRVIARWRRRSLAGRPS